MLVKKLYKNKIYHLKKEILKATCKIKIQTTTILIIILMINQKIPLENQVNLKKSHCILLLKIKINMKIVKK